MRRYVLRRSVALAAAALVVAGGIFVPSTAPPAAAAVVAGDWVPAAGTVWADVADVPAAVRDDFVRTWTLRFQVGGDAVRPTAADLTAYAGLTPAQKRGLVVALVNHWYDDVDGFAEAMAGQSGGPAWTNASLGGMVHTVVFEPEKLKGDDDPAGPAGAADPATTDAFQRLLGQASTALAGTPPPAHAPAVVLERPAITDVTVDGAARPAVLRTADALPPATAAVAVTDPVAQLQAEANRVLDSTDPIVADADTLLASATDLPVAIANTRYRACFQPTGGAAQCGAATPLGVPAAVPGGVDWQLLIGAVDVSRPGKIGFDVSLSKIDPTSTRSGHYFVRYRPPGFDRDLAVGFGDRAPLQEQQGASVVVDDPLATLNRTLVLSGRLRHNGPVTTDMALSVAYGATSSRLLVQRAPQALTARATIPLSGSPLAFGLTAPGSPVLTLEANTPQGNVAGVIDDVPSNLDVTLTRGDTFKAVYDATDVIERVTLSATDVALGTNRLNAAVSVTGVPRHLELTTGGGSVVAAGSSAITRVVGSAVLRPAAAAHPQQLATVDVVNIPTTFGFTGGEVAGVPTYSYTSTGRIASVQASYLQTTGTGAVALAAGTKLTGLPSSATLRVPTGGASIDFGSSQLDAIEAWASKGTGTALAARGDLPANQLQYVGTPSSQQAFLKVVAIKGGGFSRNANGFSADARLGGGAGLALAYADVDRSGVVRISNIPERVTFTADSNTFHYNAHGTRIERIDATASVPGMSAAAVMVGIPGAITVVNDIAGNGLTYSATSAVDTLGVDLVAGGTRAILALSGIPASWSLVANKDRVDFDAPSGISSLSAILAVNVGAVPTLPGNHVAARFDQQASQAAASLSLSNIRKVAYTNGQSRTLALKMGSGGDLNLGLDGTLSNGFAATLDGVIRNVPTDVAVTLGNDGSIDARTDRSATLTLNGGYGPRSSLNTIALPVLHGLALRDGNSGAGVAYKGRLNLVGLPTRVTVTPAAGTFHVEGLFGQPNATTLDIDVLLQAGSPRRSLRAQLANMAALPYVIDGTITSTPVTGGSDTFARLVTNRSLGSLFVAAAQDSVSGRVSVSNIPDDVQLSLHERQGSTRVVWSASQQIDWISAGLRAGFDGAFTGTLRSALSLSHLPSSIDLTVGRDGDGGGPTLSYAANADTLDASVFADGSLGSPTGHVSARLSFGIIDLARDVRATLDGARRLSLWSPSGRTTGRIEAAVSARASFNRSGSGVLNQGSAVSFPYSWGVGVNPVIENLFVTLQGVRSITIEPGVSSKLTGSWDHFGLGWQLVGASISAWGDLDAEVDWPWPFGTSRFDFLSASVTTPNLPLLVDFHRYQSFESRWQGFSWGIFGCGVNGGIDIKPNPIGAQRNGVAFNDPADDGGAYYVTPNPYGVVPGWLVDVVTFAVRPERSWGVSFGFTC